MSVNLLIWSFILVLLHPVMMFTQSMKKAGYLCPGAFDHNRFVFVPPAGVFSILIILVS